MFGASARGRIAVAVAIGAAAVVLSFRPAYEPDLGWHLAQGREAAAGELVRTNLFSFTHPHHAQSYTPWLFDLAAYGAWQAGGSAGVQLLQALLIALALGLTYGAARVRAPAAAALAMLAIGFFAIEARAIPRPHLGSFAGLAAIVWLIERARASGRSTPLWWSVPIVAVWSNLHVECVLGVAFLGLFAVVESLRPSALTRREAVRAVVIAAAACAATLANPYGWGLLSYLYENTAVPVMLDIAELRPASWPGYRGFFVFLGAAALLLISRPRQLSVWECLSFLVAAALGLRFIRLTPLVIFVAAPMVAARIGGVLARGLDARAVVATAVALGIAASPVAVTHLVTDLDAGPRALQPESVFSPRALEFIRAERLEGPVFNSNNLGGYLAWTLYPQARVFQDSRLQAYPASHFDRILSAADSQPAWDALVAGVDWAVTSRPRPNRLSGAGRFPPPEWVTVFWDEAIEILVRRDGAHRDVAATREYRFLKPGADAFVVASGAFGPDAEAVRAEARRLWIENPGSEMGARVLCLAGDEVACDEVRARSRRSRCWSGSRCACCRVCRRPSRSPWSCRP